VETEPSSHQCDPSSLAFSDTTEPQEVPSKSSPFETGYALMNGY